MNRHALHTGPTFASLALRACAKYPQRIAFQSESGSVTYAAVADYVGRMQAFLSARKIGRHSMVALLSANRWETWCASLAAQALGAGITSLHPLGSIQTQTFQLVDSGATVLIIDTASFHDRGGELSATCPGLDILTLGHAQYGLDVLTQLHRTSAATAHDLSEPGDLGTLNYTGGTTGQPKGVVRSNMATAQSALSIMADFEIPQNPRYLAIAPISHVSGTNVLPTLLMGGTIHLLRRFDPEEMLATIEKEKINFSLLVPTMIYTLLDHPALERSDVSSLELLLYGASPMSPSRLAEGLTRIGPVFSQLYGQSECYPIAVLPKSDHDIHRPELLAACGFPTASCMVTLRDDDGQLVTSGTPGEICVRAAHAMTKYWKQPELTHQAHTGGWLHTGDIAHADEQGRLYIVDRKKDMIISGGFNVYPREVEDVLTAHPAVASAAVVGITDAKWGEAVQAVVVLRPGMAVSAQELIGLVKEQKGPLHAPKTVRFVQELPVTSLGKIDKKALRQAG